jgi:hypothetical protein
METAKVNTVQEHRLAAVEYLKVLGRPATQTEVAQVLGIPRGSMGYIFRGYEFNKDAQGRVTPSGLTTPKRKSGHQLRNRNRGEVGKIELTPDHILDADGEAADHVAAELAIADRPLSLEQLHRRTHFALDLLCRIVTPPRFILTPAGVEIARYRPRF